ncbi:MAG: XRE family transcriptional regulator [Candidatus Limnocylindria bacterium]
MATTKWSDARRRLVPPDQEVAAALGRAALRDALGLANLRTSRRVTQVELAALLGRSQGNISELERRSDVYLSSLREYVAALGGDLEISAVFGDERHAIGERHLRHRVPTEWGSGVTPPRLARRLRGGGQDAERYDTTDHARPGDP